MHVGQGTRARATIGVPGQWAAALAAGIGRAAVLLVPPALFQRQLTNQKKNDGFFPAVV